MLVRPLQCGRVQGPRRVWRCRRRVCQANQPVPSDHAVALCRNSCVGHIVARGAVERTAAWAAARRAARHRSLGGELLLALRRDAGAVPRLATPACHLVPRHVSRLWLSWWLNAASSWSSAASPCALAMHHRALRIARSCNADTALTGVPDATPNPARAPLALCPTVPHHPTTTAPTAQQAWPPSPPPPLRTVSVGPWGCWNAAGSAPPPAEVRPLAATKA